MNSYSTATLCVLASLYCDAMDMSPGSLGVAMGLHDKMFPRLLEGKGCSAANAERASQWFLDNWPDRLAWPYGIKRPKGRRAVALDGAPSP